MAMKHVAVTLIFLALSLSVAVRADDRPPIVVSILETPGNVLEMPSGLLKRLEPRNEGRPEKKPEATTPAQQPETKPEHKEPERKETERKETEHKEVEATPRRQQPHAVQGYRVQVFSDNNARTAKSNAQAMQKKVAGRFPQYRSSIRYTAPYWRVRVGDFKTAAEANSAAAAIRRAFPGQGSEIRVVRERVYVVN